MIDTMLTLDPRRPHAPASGVVRAAARAHCGAFTSLLLLLWLACTLAATARAQPATAAAEAAPTSAEAGAPAIPAADIPARAGADEQYILAIVQRTQAKDPVSGFERTFAHQAADVQKLAERSNSADLSLLSVRRLESLQRHWHLFERAIAQTRAELARALNASSENLADLANRRATWQATLLTPGLAPTLLERAEDLVAQTEQAERLVAVPVGELIDIGRKGSTLANQVQAGVAAVARKVEEQDRRLLVIDTPPLWQAMSNTDSLEPVSLGLRKSLDIELAFADG